MHCVFEFIEAAAVGQALGQGTAVLVRTAARPPNYVNYSACVPDQGCMAQQLHTSKAMESTNLLLCCYCNACGHLLHTCLCLCSAAAASQACRPYRNTSHMLAVTPS